MRSLGWSTRAEQLQAQARSSEPVEPGETRCRIQSCRDSSIPNSINSGRELQLGDPGAVCVHVHPDGTVLCHLFITY